MGATPVFCDVDLQTFNVDVEQLESLVTERTVGVIAVHLFGLSADLDPILELARRRGLWLVEDAACALGAWYHGRHVGASASPALSASTRASRSRPARAGWSRRRRRPRVARALAARSRRADVLDAARRRGGRVPAHRLSARRLQLPDDRHPGRARLRADGPARRDPRRAVASSPRDTTSCWPVSTAFATPHVPDGYVHGYQAYVCLFRPEEPAPDNVERLHRARNDLCASSSAPGSQTRQGTHAPVLTAFYARKYGLRPEQFPNAHAGRSPVTRAAALPADDRGRPGDGLHRALTGVRYRLTRHVRHRRRSQPGRLARRPRGRRAHDRGDRASRPRRRRHARRPRRRPRQPAPCDHRPLTARRDADGRRRRRLRHHLQRRDLQLPRVAARARAARTQLPLAHRHGGRAARVRSNGANAASSASTACSRSRSGTGGGASSSSRATATGSSRSTSRDVGTTFLFASEIKALPRAPGLPREAVSLPHLARVLHVPEHLLATARSSTAFASLPPGRTLTIALRDGSRRERTYWDFDFTRARQTASSDEEYAEELDRLFRQAVERQLVARRPARRLPERRHGLGQRSRRSPRSTCRTSRRSPAASTSRRRPASSSASTSGARPSACRTGSRPSTTRWCSRPATWSACLPALVWHLEDPRVGQSYPNYYVARLASKFVKVVLSGAGGDELFAGYPWRYYRAVVNDDFDHYVEKYYAFWHRLLPNGVLQRVLPAGRLEAGRGRADDRHLPRRDARPAGTASRPRSTSTTRSTSRRRRSSTGCCSWTTS